MNIAHRINELSEFDTHKPKFIVVQEYTESHMGADYGPPDPPPSWETSTYMSITGFKTLEEVAAWIKQKNERRYGDDKPFKVFAIDEMTIKTEVTVSFGS